jgi:hypothetical protein
VPRKGGMIVCTRLAGRLFFVGAVVIVLISCVAIGKDIYVSPSGKADGDGSRQNPLDIVTALAKTSPAQAGDTIYLMGGTYNGKMDGIKRLPFVCEVSGVAGRTVRIMPVPGQAAHLNGVIALNSSHAEYIGLDIGDLEWDPWKQAHQSVETVIANVNAVGAKVINCNIFGGAMGTGGWSPSKELVFYGCLIHDFGELEPGGGGRGHGHAFYTQNEPNSGTKVIERNIAYRGCGWNLHIYTQGGQITGFDVIENIMYIAGGYRPGQTMDNYLCYGYVPADKIRMIGNVGYEVADTEIRRPLGPPNLETGLWRPNMRFSYLKPVQNGMGELRDNYLMGPSYGVSLGDSKKCIFAGNTVWSSDILVEVNSAPTGSSLKKRDFKPDPKNFTIENNTYYTNGKPKPFYYADSEKIDEEQRVTFGEWQKLGFDKGSKLIEGKEGKPSGTKVFVFDNKYEKGRANVAIFSWDGAESVEVDLSKVLEKGQGYKLYNCLDIRTTISRAIPVLTGIFDGAKIAFPMRRDPISPHFDAFLVVPAAVAE